MRNTFHSRGTKTELVALLKTLQQIVWKSVRSCKIKEFEVANGKRWEFQLQLGLLHEYVDYQYSSILLTTVGMTDEGHMMPKRVVD
jgi:hypothetical protein